LYFLNIERPILLKDLNFASENNFIELSKYYVRNGKAMSNVAKHFLNFKLTTKLF